MFYLSFKISRYCLMSDMLLISINEAALDDCEDNSL